MFSIQNLLSFFPEYSGNFLSYYILLKILKFLIITVCFRYHKELMQILPNISFIHYLLSLFKYHYVQIQIESTPVFVEKNGILTQKSIYSEMFQAVAFYVKMFEPDDIFYKKEPEKSEKNNSVSVFDFLIPDQSVPFLIEENCEIYAIMKYETSSGEFAKDSHPIKSKKHTITLFSKKPETTMAVLEEFVQYCIKGYKHSKECIPVQEPSLYFYEGSECDCDIMYFSEIPFRSNRTFDNVFFEEKSEFVNKIDFFLKNEEWYKKKGIPHHLGILLYGVPGCGKTSIIKSIIKHTKRHAIIVPFQRIRTNKELESLFLKQDICSKKVPISQRIYVFEDIDCMSDVLLERESSNDFGDITQLNLNKSKNMRPSDDSSSCSSEESIEDKICLSSFLNILDGLLEIPGRIIIFTSNHPEKLDKALLRPGRMDIHLELKKISVEMIKEVLEFYYEMDVEKYDIHFSQWEDHVLTPAEVINICKKNIFSPDACIEELNEKMLKKTDK